MRTLDSEHAWVFVGPHHKCIKCGATYTPESDEFNAGLPRYGCEYSKKPEQSDADGIDKYVSGFPVKMSERGLETLMKMWLSQTGTPEDILEKHFINGEGDLGVRVVRTVMATSVASMEQAMNSASNEEDSEEDDNNG